MCVDVYVLANATVYVNAIVCPCNCNSVSLQLYLPTLLCVFVISLCVLALCVLAWCVLGSPLECQCKLCRSACLQISLRALVLRVFANAIVCLWNCHCVSLQLLSHISAIITFFRCVRQSLLFHRWTYAHSHQWLFLFPPCRWIHSTVKCSEVTYPSLPKWLFYTSHATCNL